MDIGTNATWVGVVALSGNATGEISGDVTLYLDGNTNISGNGKLKILPVGVSLTIYASGTVNISGNGIVNQNITPWPEECVLLGTSICTSIIISGNEDLYAATDAPTATTSVTGNGDIYGSLVGDTVTISSNGDALFDESLQNLAVGEITDFNVTLCKNLNM